jgi:hypothetical protein
MMRRLECELAELRRLRDEIRTTIHLATSDMRESWQLLDANLDELEWLIKHESKDIREAAAEIIGHMSRTAHRMRRGIAA